MWEGNRYRNSIIQATHACWSLGATVGPTVFKLFLVELPTSDASVMTTKVQIGSTSQTTASIPKATGSRQFDSFFMQFHAFLYRADCTPSSLFFPRTHVHKQTGPFLSPHSDQHVKEGGKKRCSRDNFIPEINYD